MKPSHDRPGAIDPGNTQAKRRLWLFLLAVAGVLLATYGPASTAVSSAVDAPVADEEDADAKAPKQSQAASANPRGQRVDIIKQIPDVKILKGKPTTIIDLTGMFDDVAVAQQGVSLEYKILRKEDKKAQEKDDKVAEATLEREGDELWLTLQWGGKIGKREITLRVTNPQTGDFIDNKFNVEIWEPDYWKLVLTVIGGLGIFLLGMKSMSEGLQAVAGAGLRRMISAVTDNRFLAVGVGTGVTVLIQSSSITTVMVVGFANSGLMTLSQAVGVIMGANIGTTITGWILVLKIGKFGLPILGAAAFVYLFSNRDRVRYMAMAVMGLGMVFFGLELMKDGFGMVKNLPAFEAWFEIFDASTYFGVLGCAAVGCLLTLIVQSSSATLGITISLAVTGVIPFETGAALVLGENIGTTITALLASFGATTNAKRAAYFHMIFNIVGVAWITALFGLYMPLIKWLVGTVPGPEPGDLPVIANVTEGIALTHTLFNVTNMILFLPLVRVMASLLERVVPQRAAKEKPHLTTLDVRMLETAVIAIEQSRVEVLRMAHSCTGLAEWTKEIVSQEIADEQLVNKAFHREEVLDKVQEEIVSFMAHLLAANVPLEVAEEARCQLRMADEYESISDYLVVILKSHMKLQQSGLRFSEEDMGGLLELHDRVADYLVLIEESYRQRDLDVITKVRSRGEAVTLRVKELRNRFLARMSDEAVDPQIVVAFNAQLNAYRRVREHALNVAEAMAGEK